MTEGYRGLLQSLQENAGTYRDNLHLSFQVLFNLNVRLLQNKSTKERVSSINISQDVNNFYMQFIKYLTVLVFYVIYMLLSE